MATAPRDEEYFYSPAVTTMVSAAFGLGTNLTWDAYARDLYIRSDGALQRQANLLLERGGVTEAEARALSAQRDLVRSSIRNRLSPWGRLWSELISPAQPSFEERVLQKGSIEAVVRSVGKSRAVVNRLAGAMRVVGHATIVLQVTYSVILIVEASPEERARVAARQGGAITGGVVGGWTGAWAGCASAAVFASPALVVPVVGEVTTGVACFAGGVVGGLGGGALGAWGGGDAGEAIYDYVTSMEWIQR